MRITSGKYRSRVVKCPPGIIRPAMDRMRESLFSILGNDLCGLSFLDLFSGSGCMAIEAASRGAERVVLVEKDYKKKKTILENLSYVDEKNEVYMMDVKDYIKRFEHKDSFDVVYLDPPFPLGGKIDIINSVIEAGLLKNDGVLIIHYPGEESADFKNVDSRVVNVDSRKYGRSNLKFYKFRKE